ncbi:reverse transcriptase domain-containing protein [Tanacetum coccineum]|uniref:Reverse transcriptase domain-containing protein n=1 Tax=Tanacetum coccineum TaxID=301880 RepID=A0ABQ5FTM4_9ASTR
MSTRSNSSNLFSQLRDPESLIRRRNLGEPSSLFDFEEVMSIPHKNIGPPPAGPPPPNNNGPPPMVRPNGQAPRSMEELCQPSIDGRGGPITLIPIQATDFGLRHHMIQQQNGVSDDALRLSLFPYSLTHHVIACNTFANPRGDVKAITTRSGVAYNGPTIPPTPSPLLKEVERKTEATKDKPKPKPSLPYPSRLNDQKLREKDNNQMLKFLQIFQILHFDINFRDALLHMPKFSSTFKSLLSNKEKLFELENTPLNENSDLGASINLMPLSIWKQLSLPELTSTRITLELTDRSTIHPKGVAEDVFVKVGKFYFSADFVVVDYDVDPRVPLILGRPFLRTEKDLIDVYVNFINVSCEEYAQEVLGFSDSSSSGNPTPSDPIIASSSPSFTPFEDDDYYDMEGDILYLEKLLNEDPSLTLPPMKNDDLKQVDVTLTKPSIEEPPELELKDLPSHLEHAFLEGTDKLPIIISKELKDEEKATFLKVLKSHKWAIAWKISNIKGIDPSFYTHKILMEDDFKPAVQHQRRVNPKIHEVIKKEVIKLLDAGLIYPISDSPWFNDATRKDHFPLPFMDQMFKRLEGNEYYCFLDGFSRYFQIPVDPKDQEKTTFTCPYGTFAYRRMPFGLCNALGMFQRCMMAIFHDIIKETMEVFMG